jgi:hypothetical protein
MPLDILSTTNLSLVVHDQVVMFVADPQFGGIQTQSTHSPSWSNQQPLRYTTLQVPNIYDRPLNSTPKLSPTLNAMHNQSISRLQHHLNHRNANRLLKPSSATREVITPRILFLQRISCSGRCETRCAFRTTLTSQQLHQYELLDPEEGVAERITDQISANEGKLNSIAAKLGVAKKVSDVFPGQPAENCLHIIVQVSSVGQ